jgi:hypothetical protein
MCTPNVGCMRDVWRIGADELYSMSCEKQFLSADNTFLYCSEA